MVYVYGAKRQRQIEFGEVSDGGEAVEMAKKKTEETFTEMVARGPQEAWTIHGNLSDSSPFISRRRVGGPESLPAKTSEELFKERTEKVGWMRSLGANVELVHERINPETLTWQIVG